MIRLSTRFLSNDIRLKPRALAIKHVQTMLGQSFDCIVPVEHGACTLAATKDGEQFVPVNVISSTVRRQRYFAFDINHKYSTKCVQILTGFTTISERPRLWYLRPEKIQAMNHNQHTRASITVDKIYDLMPELTTDDLLKLIEQRWKNDSSLMTRSEIMQKRGEDTSVSIRHGRIAETYLHSLLGDMGFDAVFPEESGTPTDLIINNPYSDPISDNNKSISVQVKYTSSQHKTYGPNAYRVHFWRDGANRYPFNDSDFEMSMVCVGANYSGSIDYVYCIPMSAMIAAGITSCSSTGMKGVTCFPLRPEVEQNGSRSKYLWLNMFKIDVRKLNTRNFPEISRQFKKWIELAAKEKFVKSQKVDQWVQYMKK